MSLLLQFDFEELLYSVLECYLHSLWRYINPVNLNLNLSETYPDLWQIDFFSETLPMTTRNDLHND